MDDWLLALIVKPIAALVILGGLVLPIKMLIDRVMPDSPLKRRLFKHYD